MRDEANRMLECMANLVQHMVGDAVVVRHAHMELAEPSVAEGFAQRIPATPPSIARPRTRRT